MPPAGTDDTRKKLDFAANLRAVLARVGLDSHVFVDQFAKFAKLRKQVPTEYLAGMRRPYEENLEKLAEYLRRLAPGLQPADLELSPAEFDTRLKSIMAAPKPGGLILPMDIVPPSGQLVEQLRGSYRLFRYTSGKTRKITSEALCIFEERGSGQENTGTLHARLWPVEGNDALVYEGAVVIMGQQISIIMAHVGEHQVGMRQLSLHRDDKGLLAGLMLVPHDDGERTVSADVALAKVSKDPLEAKSDPSLRKADATVDATREILLALGPAKAV